MDKDTKKQLVIELITLKFQEFGVQPSGGNIAGLLDSLASAALLTVEEVDAQLLAYAQAKKAKIQADKDALESQKLQAEEHATQEINKLDGILAELDSGDAGT